MTITLPVVIAVVFFLSFSITILAIWNLANESEEDLLERTEKEQLEEELSSLEKHLSGKKLQEKIGDLDSNNDKEAEPESLEEQFELLEQD